MTSLGHRLLPLLDSCRMLISIVLTVVAAEHFSMIQLSDHINTVLFGTSAITRLDTAKQYVLVLIIRIMRRKRHEHIL